MPQGSFKPSPGHLVNPASPFGPTRREHDWIDRGACTKPDVDPDWFVADETDTTAIGQAKTVCRACEVRLLCRIWAYETNEWGVYAGETYTERTAKLDRRHQMFREEVAT
jgi:biotin carboxylase